MKKVLIVDDEAFIIKLLTRILTNYVKDLTLFTAEDGEEAVSILSSESIDLVITDLQMPVMDGFELIAHIMQNFHSLPIIILTGYSPEKLENRLKQSSSLTLVQKHNLDFRAFSEQVTKALTPVTRGHIEGITLFSFLQLLNLDKKTCTLTIRAGGQKGFLYFSSGQLISAICEGIESIYSAYEILVWDNVKIEIDNICRKKKNVINAPLDEVLMDAFKIKDEANRENGVAASDDLLDVTPLLETEKELEEEFLEEIPVSRIYTSDQALTEILSVPGVISCSLLDLQQDSCLVSKRAEDSNESVLSLEAVKAIFASLEKQTENVLVTLPSIYYFLCPLTVKERNLFFNLTLDRSQIDLSQIKLKIMLISKNISL